MAEHRGHSESGYALLAVLWITLGITGLLLAISTSARTATAASRNRIALSQAHWKSIDCLTQVMELVYRALESSSVPTEPPGDRAWDQMGQALQQIQRSQPTDCETAVRPSGSKLNVNAADAATLARLLRYAGMRTERADSVAELISSHRPYTDLREIHEVPGLQSEVLLDSLLGVEPGPILLNHAPGPVLMLLPGFTPETVRQVLEARRREAPIAGFLELSRLLDPDASGAAAQLPGLAVFHAAVWVVTVRAASGSPAVTRVLEAGLGLTDAGPTIRHRRSWIE